MHERSHITVLLFLVMMSLSLVAQVISGKVVDGATRRSLESVNVYLQRASDSSVVTGAVPGKWFAQKP